MYYNIYNDKDYIDLAPQFRFCQNMFHYMIFKNGVRVEESKWSLTAPGMDKNTLEWDLQKLYMKAID